MTSPSSSPPKNSVVFDSNGEKIGTLTSNNNKILLGASQISTNVKNAVVSIEDSRFYEHNGVDFQGIGRALIQDVLSQSAQQGASTITEQFVKSALDRPGQPHDPAEVPRGGPRLPAGAPLVEGQDPHRVPEHDLLRRGRLRDRGRGPHLLRQLPSGLRHHGRALRLGALPLGGGDAGRDHRLALGVRPEDQPPDRARPAQPGAREDEGPGLHHRGRLPDRASTGRCPRRTTSSRPPSTRRRPTSPPGCASSWSTSTARPRPSSAG